MHVYFLSVARYVQACPDFNFASEYVQGWFQEIRSCSYVSIYIYKSELYYICDHIAS